MEKLEMKRYAPARLFTILGACLALSVFVVACEPAEEGQMSEEMSTLDGELFSVGAPLSTSPLEQPEMGPDAGFCAYTCEDDAAIDTVGNCGVGTGCDRMVCDGEANGVHLFACIDLPEAPEQPVTTYNLDPPKNRCAYLCGDQEVLDVVGACDVGYGCTRDACEGEDNGVHIDACIQIKKATKDVKEMQPLKPYAPGSCASLCEKGQIVEEASWCGEGTKCSADACRFEEDGVTHTRCIIVPEFLEEEAETSPVSSILDLEVGTCGYRCSEGEIVDYRSNCEEGTGCAAEACEGNQYGMVVGECI